MSGDDKKIKISEVVEQTSVSRRTIRFYVQQGLIDPPRGKGRGSYYTERHIQQILTIRKLQRQGAPLDQIKKTKQISISSNPVNKPTVFRQSVVIKIKIKSGVFLEIDTRNIQPTEESLQKIADFCDRILI